MRLTVCLHLYAHAELATLTQHLPQGWLVRQPVHARGPYWLELPAICRGECYQQGFGQLLASGLVRHLDFQVPAPSVGSRHGCGA